jgi:hypothetical protein
MDDETFVKFIALKKKVNEVKDFESMFPSDTGSIHMLINWVAYFIHPTWDDLDILTGQYGIELNDKEKKAIYPQIIEFILFVKEKFQTA